MYNPDIHHRRSVRIKGYDYTQPGKHYITIITNDRNHLFGEITNGYMQLNRYGQIVKDQWLKTADIRENVNLDTYIIMPNHIHAIIILTATGNRVTKPRDPIKNTEQFGKPVSGSIPTIIRSFKSVVTKHINIMRQTPGNAVWQRGYYGHIINNDRDLNRIRQYIADNPIKWDETK